MVSAKFSDKCIENIKSDQLVGLKKELGELSELSDNLKMLDEAAVKEIAENMKKIVDGGSDEMKKAMDKFNQLTESLADFLKKIDEIRATANNENFDLDRKITNNQA